MPKFQDLSGQKFERLTVIKRAENHISPSGYISTRWLCQCECGNIVKVNGRELKSGKTRSCGCLRKELLSQTKFIDLTGQVFGRLTVLERVKDYISPSNDHHVQYLCRCECGNKVIISSQNLKSGNSKSCGCYSIDLIVKRNTTHNASKTKLYSIFSDMKDRCNNPNNSKYKDYGERGISVCSEWINDFTIFADWAYKNGYIENANRGECTIDRIDVNGNYCPENCRWVNQRMQCNNKRNNHYITYKDKTHTITEWSRITNIKRQTLEKRLSLGWCIEDVFNKPVKKRGNINE